MILKHKTRRDGLIIAGSTIYHLDAEGQIVCTDEHGKWLMEDATRCWEVQQPEQPRPIEKPVMYKDITSTKEPEIVKHDLGIKSDFIKPKKRVQRDEKE